MNMRVDVRRDIPELTGLRFVAAFCILLAHTFHWLCYSLDPIPYAVTVVMRLAAIAMPLFFVLSGFVIHYNYGNFFVEGIKKKYFKFVWIRLARLYPLYIVCILLSISCFYFGYRPNAVMCETDYLASKFPYFITLTQSCFFQTYQNTHHFSQILLGISWSVSTEFFFYLCYPFLAYGILNRLTMPKLFFTLILYFSMAYTLLYGMYNNTQMLAESAVSLGLANEKTRSVFLYWLTYLSPYIRILEFMTGCLAAHFVVLLRDMNLPRPLTSLLHCVAISTCLFILYLVYYGPPFIDPGLFSYMRVNFLLALPIFILLCLIGFLNRSGVTIWLFSNKIFVRLGEISYSLYLMQAFTISAIMIFGPQPANQHPNTYIVLVYIIRCLAALMLTIVVSFISYRFIEKPGKIFLRTLPERLYEWRRK